MSIKAMASPPPSGVSGATAPPQKNEKVYNAAQMYEQQFLREMVKAMRSTVSESDLMPASMGEKIFREQLDEKYVEGWRDRGGVGFADMIYDHIMERYFNSKGSVPKPKGPLPLEHSQGTVKSLENGVQINVKPNEGNKPQAVLAPWGGNIYQINKDGQSVGIIRHDNGLESQISYSGVGTKSEGRVEAGERIGLRNLGDKGLHWLVKLKT